MYRTNTRDRGTATVYESVPASQCQQTRFPTDERALVDYATKLTEIFRAKGSFVELQGTQTESIETKKSGFLFQNARQNSENDIQGINLRTKLTASPRWRRRGRGSSGWLRDRVYQVAALSLGELAGASAPTAAEEHDESRGDARQQRRAREQRPDDT